VAVAVKKLQEAYLDLLSDVLINAIYPDGSLLPRSRRAPPDPGETLSGFITSNRDKGLDWPAIAHSMIGRQRMRNLRDLCCRVVENRVPGDFIETGVWRGGACILMRGVLRAFGDTRRKVWVADSFAGLPPPNAERYAADAGDKHHKVTTLAVGLEQVHDNFRRYGLLDDQVQFLKGWFRDTLPDAPIQSLAILRLDGDMYESTMDGLVNLYHKVSPGGYVIVDDYHAVKGCKLAVHDFLGSLGAAGKVDICEIDGSGVYWQIVSAGVKRKATKT
jgi:O-methyltransferase